MPLTIEDLIVPKLHPSIYLQIININSRDKWPCLNSFQTEPSLITWSNGLWKINN